MFRNLPPPELPPLLSAATDPKASQEKGFSLDPGMPLLPRDPLGVWRCSSKPGTLKIPCPGGEPGCSPGPRAGRSSHGLHHSKGSQRGSWSRQSLPDVWDSRFFLQLLHLLKAQLLSQLLIPVTVTSAASVEQLQTRGKRGRSQRFPFYSQIIIVLCVPGGDLTQPPGEHKNPINSVPQPLTGIWLQGN